VRKHGVKITHRVRVLRPTEEEEEVL